MAGPYGSVTADGAGDAGAWAKADPAERANAQASASIRNIWKASSNSAAAATRERHNKVQNLKVEATLCLSRNGRGKLRINVIATPGASRRNQHYICLTNQGGPACFHSARSSNYRLPMKLCRDGRRRSPR